MINNVLRQVRRDILKTIIIFIRFLFRVKLKTIVFISFGGDQYSDNPRAITEKFIDSDTQSVIYWIFNKNKIPEILTVLPAGIKVVKNNTLSMLFVIARSQIIISNFELPTYFTKSPKQVYIQTYHADRPFKKVLADVIPNIKLIEPKFCDYIMTGSSFGERFLSSAFRYNGQFLRFGLPRNDALFSEHNNYKAKILEFYGLHESKKIILFAPTFRDNLGNKKQKPGFSAKTILKLLDDNDGWVFMFRSHRASKGIEGLDEDVNIINVTNYPDMLDLLCASDILISDYSSCVTDYILTDKPVILFHHDLEEYIKFSRDMYNEIKEIGFVIAYNENELYQNIANYKNIDFKIVNENVRKYYGVYENGTAAEKIVAFLNELTNSKLLENK